MTGNFDRNFLAKAVRIGAGDVFAGWKKKYWKVAGKTIVVVAVMAICSRSRFPGINIFVVSHLNPSPPH